MSSSWCADEELRSRSSFELELKKKMGGYVWEAALWTERTRTSSASLSSAAVDRSCHRGRRRVTKEWFMLCKVDVLVQHCAVHQAWHQLLSSSPWPRQNVRKKIKSLEIALTLVIIESFDIEFDNGDGMTHQRGRGQYQNFNTEIKKLKFYRNQSFQLKSM